jgi:outer membrane protein assembly factor BamC
MQIDQGVQPETSEIHITHVSIPSDSKPAADFVWPEASVNAEREKWLLDELAATLASDTTEGGTSLLAQAIGGSAKAGLVMLRNEPVLSLRLDRQRALGTLAHAVKQEGFTPYDSDSDTGLFYVHYRKLDPDGPGWFSRLFGLSEKEVIKPTSPYSLEVLTANLPEGDALEKAPFSDRDAETKLPDAPGYLLMVSGADNDLVVRLRDPYGKRLDPRKTREMLTVIRKNLI